MPLQKRWSSFTKENVMREDDYYGVYELGNSNGDILYIGQVRIRTRLMAHLPNRSDPIVGVSFYRVEYTGSKVKAEQRERAELGLYYKRTGRYPKFNQRRG